MRQRFFILIGIAAVALVASTAALAGTLTTTATVTGAGGLSLNLPSNPSITNTLDGTDQAVSYAPVLGLTDARGLGTGWNLTISATTFSRSGFRSSRILPNAFSTAHSASRSLLSKIFRR